MSSEPQKEEKYIFCGCQCGCPPDQPARPRAFSCAAEKESIRTIKVLDTENQASRQLYHNVLDAAAQLGFSPEISYITEPKKTSPYYADLPAIVKDERVISQGVLCTVAEITELLQK